MDLLPIPTSPVHRAPTDQRTTPDLPSDPVGASAFSSPGSAPPSCDGPASVVPLEPALELHGPISLPLDIFAVLAEHSEFILLASWRATSRQLFRVVGAEMRFRYERRVRPFVPNIAALDELLLIHGAVISGSVALCYFLPRALWEPNDIDIYVPASQFEAFVVAATDPERLNFTIFPQRRPWKSLDSRETTVSVDDVAEETHLPDAPIEASTDESSQVSDESHVPSSHAGLREVRQFYTVNDRRVDIISVPWNNPVVALKRFWSPLVMNFIRPNMAACGFPLTTLHNSGILKPDMTARDHKAAGKYVARGFDLVGQSPPADDGCWEDVFFGARKALVIPCRRFPRGRLPAFTYHSY